MIHVSWFSFGKRAAKEKEAADVSKGDEVSVVYVCRECGDVSPVPEQVCPICGEWRAMVEETEAWAIRRLKTGGVKSHDPNEGEKR